MSQIEPFMIENIKNKIAQIEKDYDVDIIFAIESGSRAWGFESKDSDYDVRFVYRHRMDYYVDVIPERDVIELPINDIDDYSGWDIRKALFLMNKSNPSLFEWINSPIVYKKDEKRFNLIKQAAEQYFLPVSSMYHYIHMAKGNYREYLRGEKVKIKKYFYVLRPLLACMWIKDRCENPPIEFEKLLSMIKDEKLLIKIDELLKKKRQGIESDFEDAIPEINRFIEEQISFFDAYTMKNDKHKPDRKYLNSLLFELVR